MHSVVLQLIIRPSCYVYFTTLSATSLENVKGSKKFLKLSSEFLQIGLRSFLLLLKICPNFGKIYIKKKTIRLKKVTGKQTKTVQNYRRWKMLKISDKITKS